jgi:hypothetical protein
MRLSVLDINPAFHLTGLDGGRRRRLMTECCRTTTPLDRDYGAAHGRAASAILRVQRHYDVFACRPGQFAVIFLGIRISARRAAARGSNRLKDEFWRTLARARSP